MDYQGFFINLNRSTGRRAEMEAHLMAYGVGDVYRRFSAAEGNSLHLPKPNFRLLAGEIGCFISHYLLLKENLGCVTPIHVIEDDVLFSTYTKAVIQSLIVGGSFDHYDVIYLDTFVSTSNFLYKKYHELYRQNVKRDASGKVEEVNFKVIDMKDIEFAVTASMVISPRGIEKLCALYAAELAAGPTMQIDLFIRSKVREGAITLGCVFPFATSVRLEHVLGTTLGESNLRLSALTTVLARHSFFVEGDLKACLEYASKYLVLSPNDLHLHLLNHLLGFSLDDRFRFS